MMNCHFCNQEAVGRCYTCGNLFCAEHGHVNCTHCETGIASGDPRPDRVSAVPLTEQKYRPGCWRPQAAEDFHPPACHICKGLARKACAHCNNFYCPEHAGKNGLCSQCHRSSNFGIFILVGMFAIILFLVAVGYFWSR